MRNASCRLWNTSIITQQNAGEKRSLRFGENLRDDVFRMNLEGEQPSEWRKALIAREHRHARTRHERVHALSSEVLAIRKVGRVGRRLEFALDTQVSVRIARVWFTDDDAFTDDGLLLIVIRGKRGRVKARLHRVVSERTHNRGEGEDEHPARPRRAGRG